MDDKNKGGILYIISTPIGNTRDITLRALDVLKAVDFIICEEFKAGSTLLKKLGLAKDEIWNLNEHNEKEQTPKLINYLLEGKSGALISDCGTPAFADPGTLLIKECVNFRITVKSIPGPSSLMAAISLSPLPIKEFYFAGFLPRENQQRIFKLKSLRRLEIPIILMDTPYRLQRLVEDVKLVFGKQKKASLMTRLTQPGEMLFHGSIEKIQSQIKGQKAEFILILH